MKTRFWVYFTSILCALTVLVSGPFAFADKGDIIKAGRKALTGKTKGAKISPKTSSSAARKGVSRVAVERAAMVATQQGSLSTSAVRKKGTSTTGGELQMPSKQVLKTPEFKLPGLSGDTDVANSGLELGVEDTGTNLTGVEVLNTYSPTWRQELGGMFSNEQLDAVERTFAATDEWMFTRGEDGELQIRNKDEWNYEARFLTLLQESGVSFTERQIKQLIGAKGMKGFTFKIYFFRMKATGFSCAKGTKPRQIIYQDRRRLKHEEMTPQEIQEVVIGQGLSTYGNHPAIIAYMQENRLQAEYKTAEEYVALARQYDRKPRSDISRNGHKLTREEMTPEEIQEVIIGEGLARNANHPAVIAYMQENRLQAETKTAEEYVALARQYDRKPRKSIHRNGHILTREEMTPEEIQEVNVGNGLNTHRNHPAVIAYMQENRLRAETKTAEEYVALAKQYPTKPRSAIYRDSHYLSNEEMTPQEIQEVNIGTGLARNRNHPTVIAYMQENRLQTKAQTTEQLYTALVTHIKNYGHYPMRKENSLQTNIYSRLYRYQSTMVDGKYADPYLQKIYELKEWSERVKRGEVDWTQFPGLFKKHRRTIDQMRGQGQQPSTEAAKEFETLSAEEQQAIEEMADNVLTLWENFEEKWWQENQSHIVMTPNTRVAFDTVLNAVRHQVPGANNVNISNVLEQVSGMQLGQDGPEYYRVIYRGNNPRIPRAEDFHNVEEIPGLPQRFAEPAYKLDKPHIFLDGDEDVVLNMFLNPGVTDREMSTVINAITPAGWEVRIGAHELLRDIKKGQMHIHIEKIVPTTEEGAQDISYVLNVKLRQLTRGQNPQQVAKTLRYLFSNYLTEEGQWALNNIQKAF